MSAENPQHNQDHASLNMSEVLPINGSGGQLVPNRDKLFEIVEPGALNACLDLYDKNIRTTTSSANGGHQEAFIHIDFDSLSDDNKQTVEAIAQIFEPDDANDVRYARLAVPIEATDTEDSISQKLTALSEQLKKQELQWANQYTIDDLKRIYAVGPDDEASPEDFVGEGYYYDQTTGLFHESEELYQKSLWKEQDGNPGDTVEEADVALSAITHLPSTERVPEQPHHIEIPNQFKTFIYEFNRDLHNAMGSSDPATRQRNTSIVIGRALNTLKGAPRSSETEGARLIIAAESLAAAPRVEEGSAALTEIGANTLITNSQKQLLRTMGNDVQRMRQSGMPERTISEEMNRKISNSYKQIPVGPFKTAVLAFAAGANLSTPERRVAQTLISQI
jgi:hypothetical protein